MYGDEVKKQIERLVREGSFNKAIAFVMSKQPQRKITIHTDESSDIELSDILEQVGDTELLVNNALYDYEAIDYTILDNKGNQLLSIDENGQIADTTIEECLREDCLDHLLDVYHRIQKCDAICTVLSD